MEIFWWLATLLLVGRVTWWLAERHFERNHKRRLEQEEEGLGELETQVSKSMQAMDQDLTLATANFYSEVLRIQGLARPARSGRSDKNEMGV